MAETPSYLRAVSLHLCRILDEVGLNKDTVRRRRGTFLFLEQLHSVFLRLTGNKRDCFHFGSQTEGSTTPGLDSDIDTLYSHPDFNVIQDWTGWQQGKENRLMLQDRTAPGYCRLQVLRDDVPMAEEVLRNVQFIYDSDGRVLVKNTSLNTPELGSPHVRNGPATSELGEHGASDTDYVLALHCKSWPTQAEEFTRRHRRHGWPPQNLIQKAVKCGVFLVPVGYKLSPTEHLEWRISASLAERCLMFSLDTVHIKCYVVLKMLVKTCIEPRARKCISSYHCKTAIFYSVENTDPDFWRENNLLQCITQCLTIILTWVTDGFCPQFVIAEENLFAGKVTAQNRHLLQSILNDLIMGNVRALLHVHIDDLGHKLQRKLCTAPSTVPVLDSRGAVWLKADLEFNRHREIARRMMGISVEDKNTKPVTLIRSVYRTIVVCKGRIRHSAKHERNATKVYIENLSRWLGSLLASFSLSYEMRIPRMALKLLRIGLENEVASILKLASVFYNDGSFRKVETILSEVEHHSLSYTMQPVCGCYPHKPQRKSPLFVHNIHLLRGNTARSKLFAHCVRFSPQEIHCVPPALWSEFFRSVGDDLQHRNPTEHEWMDLAAVDFLPLLYYLQYMTYRQLGKRDLYIQSLYNFDRCLRSKHGFGHHETGWNLLGQCKELEQDWKAAMTCYSTSLEIRPRNNAANWHVAILCYNLIKPSL